MIRRCSKGHWYDTSTNKVCPHCKLESEKLGIVIQDVEEDVSVTEDEVDFECRFIAGR